MNKIKRDWPRPVKFTPHVNPYALGSVLVEFGNTKVQVTVMLEENVPPFLQGKGRGWVTAEYAMLPSATHQRNQRERKGISGRSQEIQRLIGRSLRAVVDLEALGERSLLVDCDVLVADGGTRTASISGGYVALALACKKLKDDGKILSNPLKDKLAAVSIGINKQGEIITDLNYEEDSSCDTDLNVVMTGSGEFVEVQGTAEGRPFSQKALQDMLACAEIGIQVIFKAQQEALQ